MFNNHVSLVDYCGFNTTVFVPKKIDGKPVIMLYENAVKNRNVKKMIIPLSVHCETSSYTDKGIEIERI